MRSLALVQVAEQSGNAAELHRGCFACGLAEGGLGLVFDGDGLGGVRAEWFCEERYQSYPGIVHGGIIATVLDAAMTNCLLSKGIAAVTANMQVEYRGPVRVRSVATLRASLTRSRPPLFVLRAEVAQNGIVCASATAKFMRADTWDEPCTTTRP